MCGNQVKLLFFSLKNPVKFQCDKINVLCLKTDDWIYMFCFCPSINLLEFARRQNSKLIENDSIRSFAISYFKNLN
jgi:hypothetical protein